MEYLVQKSRVPGTDWHLLVFSELAPSQDSARITAALSTLIFVLAALVVLYVQQRRRFVTQTVASRAALGQANDQLEVHVRERTQALRTANEQLQGEIVERKRAEETLRATLEDLVHTARMAVLGQMSAGITHELNQPLAALRTLSGNAMVFLGRGQQAEAVSNLRIIGQLTDHMGKITSQLKKFARKSLVELQSVHVPSVANDTMFLLSQSMKLSRVRIDQDYVPNDLTALCDANLLEQVLLNLLTNAFDAVSDIGQPHVLLRGEIERDTVRIEVHDNGAGIADHVAPHLFEPFYSTKEQGEGLGLGLAISADIVRQLGGTLTHGRSSVLGGARFTVLLSVAEQKIVYD
jgi:two-component system C4-dicarboxylate transport sensor histidine kinase DctB